MLTRAKFHKETGLLLDGFLAQVIEELSSMANSIAAAAVSYTENPDLVAIASFGEFKALNGNLDEYPGVFIPSELELIDSGYVLVESKYIEEPVEVLVYPAARRVGRLFDGDPTPLHTAAEEVLGDTRDITVYGLIEIWEKE